MTQNCFVKYRDVNTGPGSCETSDLPSYRDRLYQSTDCPCGNIQTELLAAAESTEQPVC